MSGIASWVQDPTEYEGVPWGTLANRCELFRNQRNALLERLAEYGDEYAMEWLKRINDSK